MTLSIEDFLRVDIRCGTVRAAETNPEARRPAIQLWIDFGPELGQLKSSAQITSHYRPEDLVGRQVLAVVNFPPKQIGKMISQCLVLGCADENGDIVLASLERPVPDGRRLH